MELINRLLELYLNIVLIDFLRYFIPASLAFILCWKLLKSNIRHRFIQSKWPKTERLWSEFKYSISTIFIFALNGTGIVVAKINGLTKLYADVSKYGVIYLGISLVIMILFHDMYFYWTHRWMHLPKIYRYVHRVHHLSTNPSPWAAYSFHPLEAIVQALVFPIILFSIPIHSGVAFTFLIYMIVRNVWGHLGFELFPQKFMQWRWINWHTTTTHHNLHHEKFNSNFGLYFTWWDKWFGTEHGQYKEQFDQVTSRTKRKSIATMLMLLLSFTALGQSPQGWWMTYDERNNQPLSIIRIYENKVLKTWEGEIDSIIVAPHLAEQGRCTQCTGDKRNEAIIGLEILSGFKRSGDEWRSGKILDPESGKEYSSKIWFTDPDNIYVRGYAGPFDLFYRTQQWRRLTEGTGISGTWESIDDRYQLPRAHIHIKEDQGKLIGQVKKIFLLPHEGNYPICLACKDELKDQPIVGMKIMTGYTMDGGDWTDGSILDPANGTTYSSSFWLTDANTLKIRGYWGPFFRTQEWKRIDK